MNRSRRSLLALLPLLATACASGPPPLRSTKLEVIDDGRHVRPYVHATVNGKPVRLLLDTGAFQSLLGGAFARAEGLRLRTSAGNLELKDANGQRRSLAVASSVPVRIDGEGERFALDFLVNPSWDHVEGILSPQELLRRGWAMTIDLEGAELRFDPEPEALARLRDGGASKVEYATCPDEGLFNDYHRVVTTLINGTPARMLLDTGCDQTVLSRNNPALPTMLEAVGRREKNAGMVSTSQGLVVDDVEVQVAGAAFRQAVLVLPASQTCWQGALGADFLRRCTVVWGWSDLWMACRSKTDAARADARP